MRAPPGDAVRCSLSEDCKQPGDPAAPVNSARLGTTGGGFPGSTFNLAAISSRTHPSMWSRWGLSEVGHPNRRFAFGTNSNSVPLTNFSLAEKGASASSKNDGSIGSGILSRFKLILDYPQKRMTLDLQRELLTLAHDAAGRPPRCNLRLTVLDAQQYSATVWGAIDRHHTFN